MSGKVQVQQGKVKIQRKAAKPPRTGIHGKTHQVTQTATTNQIGHPAHSLLWQSSNLFAALCPFLLSRQKMLCGTSVGAIGAAAATHLLPLLPAVVPPVSVPHPPPLLAGHAAQVRQVVRAVNQLKGSLGAAQHLRQRGRVTEGGRRGKLSGAVRGAGRRKHASIQRRDRRQQVGGASSGTALQQLPAGGTC